jgi:hypothetical protein
MANRAFTVGPYRISTVGPAAPGGGLENWCAWRKRKSEMTETDIHDR